MAMNGAPDIAGADVAVTQAVAVKAGGVTFGAHAGDHPIHPDYRPAFLEAYRRMVPVADEGFLVPQFTVLAQLPCAIEQQETHRVQRAFHLGMELTIGLL